MPVARTAFKAACALISASRAAAAAAAAALAKGTLASGALASDDALDSLVRVRADSQGGMR